MTKPSSARLLRKLYGGNILDRIAANEITQLQNATRPVRVAELSELATDLGQVTAGSFIAPASGVTTSEPTDSAFTGAAMGGNGWTFGDTVYQFVAVLLGVLQVGFNYLGQFVAGAGNVFLDASGVSLLSKASYLAAAALKWYDGSLASALVADIYSDYYVDGEGRWIRVTIRNVDAEENTAAKITLYNAPGTVSDRVDIETDEIRLIGTTLLNEQASPSTPSSGYGAVYFKTDSLPYAKNDGGFEYRLGLPYHGRFVPIEDDFFDVGANVQLGHGLVYNAISTGTVSAPAAEAGHPGIARFSQYGPNTGYAINVPNSFMVFDGQNICEVVFRLQSTTDIVCRLGFQDSYNTAAPTDAAYIHIAGTTLDGRVYNAGGTTTTGTSYTVAATTWYRLKIRVDGGTAYFELYALGTEAAVWSASVTSANVPDNTCDSSVALVGYKTTNGSADIIDVDWLGVYSLTGIRG